MAGPERHCLVPFRALWESSFTVYSWFTNILQTGKNCILEVQRGIEKGWGVGVGVGCLLEERLWVSVTASSEGKPLEGTFHLP